MRHVDGTWTAQEPSGVVAAALLVQGTTIEAELASLSAFGHVCSVRGLTSALPREILLAKLPPALAPEVLAQA